MRSWTIKLSLGISLMGALLLCEGASAQSLQQQQDALNLITETADKFCRNVPLTGADRTAEVSGEAKAEVVGLLKKLANLGLGTAAKYQQQRYEGVLQADLIRALENDTRCRLQIWSDLSNRLLFSPPPSAHTAVPGPEPIRSDAEEWELLADEDFTRAVEGWPAGPWQDQSSRGSVSRRDGVIRMEGVFSSHWLRKFDLPYPAVLSAKLGVDVRFVGGSDSEDEVGLLFERVERTELDFRLQRKGSYGLTRAVDEGPNEHVLEWVRVAANTSEWNRLEVEVVDQTITLLLNGSVAAQYRDPDYRGGTVGLLVGGGVSSSMAVEFDNFSLHRKRPGSRRAQLTGQPFIARDP